MTPLDHALDYAGRGWKVFPCNPSPERGVSKRPLIDHGFKAASRDEAQIRAWWTQWPDALIGVPMGRENGVWAIDPDVAKEPGDADGLKAWQTIARQHPPIRTHTHLTPSGGKHLLFRWREDRPVTNTERGLRARGIHGINVRGEGGYVIAVGSRLTDGRSYEIEDPMDFFHFAEAEGWLYELLEEPAPEARQSPKIVDFASRQAPQSRYVQSAIAGECWALAQSGRGERNNQLNAAAFSLGQLVGAGLVDEDTVRGELISAATSCGLIADDGERPVRATIESGLAAGRQKPRDISNRQGSSMHAASAPNDDASAAGDSPLPLFPPLAAPEPYPMDALGPLAEAARAIARKVQVPDAIAAQSVLAAASLAVQAHCDVRLPFGQVRPLSCDFVTVAASGDRKTSADNEALWPVYRHESNLREAHIAAMEQYRIDHTAWSAEKRHIETNKKLPLADRKHALAMLGAEPERPLAPFIVTGDLTPDGLTKNWPWAHAALGVFTAEGGVFTGSHGMSEDNRLRTAAMLSELWDGKPVKRIRAGDGVSILPGRRLALHVMVQPHAAATFLADPVLRDQGLLSRVLVAAPTSIAGTRLYRETAPEDDAAIRSYGARILTILEKRPPLADGTRNELTPATLEISAGAGARWRQFFNHVEQALRGDDEFRGIQDFAAKAAEHAARIAGVLTAYANLDAEEIGPEAMDCAIGLMDFYVGEALRLHAAGRTNPDLLMAQRLLDWMRADGAEREPMAFRYILQHGPGPIRTKETLERIVSILMKHGWVRETSSRPRMLIAVGEA